MRFLIHRLFFVALLLSTVPGHAQDLPAENTASPSSTDELPEYPWTFTVAPYVHHWRKNPDHRYAFIFSLEKHQDANQLLGLALFRNSFGQPSAYAYTAYQWEEVLGDPRLTAKISAGIIYGYKGAYADKVPLNWHGYSPGLIPALGYKVTERDTVQVMLLGGAGFSLGYGHSF